MSTPKVKRMAQDLDSAQREDHSHQDIHPADCFSAAYWSCSPGRAGSARPHRRQQRLVLVTWQQYLITNYIEVILVYQSSNKTE